MRGRQRSNSMVMVTIVVMMVMTLTVVVVITVICMSEVLRGAGRLWKTLSSLVLLWNCWRL